LAQVLAWFEVLSTQPLLFPAHHFSMTQNSSASFVALVQATAGALGGLVASVGLQPVEVVKTRVQVSDSGTSTLETAGDILKDEGLVGFFRGVSAKSAETSVKNFVYFYIYDALNTSAKLRWKLTTPMKLLLGYTAGVGTTTLTMPLEVLATKVQVASAGKGALAVLRATLDKEGLRGFFRGYWFNVLLCVNPAISNTCFDKLKAAILRYEATQWRKMGKSFTFQTYPTLNPGQAFMLGAVAKGIATIVTFPLVRIKTMMQAGKDLQRKEKSPSEESPLEILAQLYRGIGSALMKSVLQAALLYMTKDQIESFVVKIFKISMKMMRRRSGRLKLGVTSGRPLPS